MNELNQVELERGVQQPLVGLEMNELNQVELERGVQQPLVGLEMIEFNQVEWSAEHGNRSSA